MKNKGATHVEPGNNEEKGDDAHEPSDKVQELEEDVPCGTKASSNRDE